MTLPRSSKEQDAGLLAEYIERADRMPTKRNMEIVQQMQEWFFKKHGELWQKPETQKGRSI